MTEEVKPVYYYKVYVTTHYEQLEPIKEWHKIDKDETAPAFFAGTDGFSVLEQWAGIDAPPPSEWTGKPIRITGVIYTADSEYIIGEVTEEGFGAIQEDADPRWMLKVEVKRVNREDLPAWWWND